MSTETPPSNDSTVINDPYKHLPIMPAADGTITRLPERRYILPIPPFPIPILTKDITINQSNKTWARIFLPKQTLDHSSSHTTSTKLPLIVWIHGGGFVLFSAASTFFHDACVKLAIEVPAVVVSVEYRLAPEHRLPAAYEDAVEALQWIKTTPDEWLREFADLSNCFLMGISAGANIIYHAGLHVAEKLVDDLQPLKIRGLILNQPFFGGSKRTESELRMVNDPHLPLCSNDLMWELALPIGADRDHEYSNPMVEGGSKALDKMRELGWRIMVVWGDLDPLMDRQVELIRMLQEKGLQVVSRFFEGHFHGQEVAELSKCNPQYVAFKSFISSVSMKRR